MRNKNIEKTMQEKVNELIGRSYPTDWSDTVAVNAGESRFADILTETAGFYVSEELEHFIKDN